MDIRHPVCSIQNVKGLRIDLTTCSIPILLVIELCEQKHTFCRNNTVSSVCS